MTDKTPAPERIAKVMARAGVASRRDAERLIVSGRVAVNGKVIDSPALDVLPSDKVTLDGKPIDAPQATRMWLYYKPLGLVTSEKDEKGRQTVFESLPDGLPRVMSVGRLDLNSEGLLLLTNDGALKRRLELPETGWLRKYRVRVNGHPNDQILAPLRNGMTVKGEDGRDEAFLPMEITIDKQQGANAWLTVGLREGKNREIRRAMSEVGLVVNRLIRVSYGPFRLNLMKPGEAIEVKARVMREQLGNLLTGEAADDAPARPERGPRGGRDDRKPYGKPRAPGGDDRKPFAPRKPREDGDAPRSFDRKPRAAGGAGDDRKPYSKPRAAGGDDRKPYAPRKPREDGDAPRSFDRKPRAASGAGDDRKPYGKPRAAGGAGDDRKAYGKPRAAGGAGDDRKPYSKPRAAGGAGDDRKPYAPRKPREDGDAPRSFDRKPRATSGAGDDRKPYGKPRAAAGAGDDRKPYGKPRAEGDRKPYAPRKEGDAPRSFDRKPRTASGAGDDRKSYGKPGGSDDRKPYGKPRAASGASGDRKPYGGKPTSTGDRKPYGKPAGAGGRPQGGKPAGGAPRKGPPRKG